MCDIFRGCDTTERRRQDLGIDVNRRVCSDPQCMAGSNQIFPRVNPVG